MGTNFFSPIVGANSTLEQSCISSSQEYMEFAKKKYEQLKRIKICKKVKPLVKKLCKAAAHLSRRRRRPQLQVPEKPLAFMSCTIEVDNSTGGSQKALRRVMRNIHIRNFKMDTEGKVDVSGLVNPAQLLKAIGKGGKRTKLSRLQFGECSSNLFEPPPPAKKEKDPPQVPYYGQTAIGYGHGSLPYSGYGSNRYPYFRPFQLSMP